MSNPDDRGGRGEAGWLRPAGAVTGIGSLPTTDPLTALEFVAAYAPLLPFCPQPPSPDLLVDTLDQQLEHVAETTDRWLGHFMSAVDSGAFPRARALKSQVTGPLTLAGLLGARGGGGTSPALIGTLAEHVACRAVFQAHRLQASGLPVLIVVDEPALVLTDLRQSVRPRDLLSGIFRRIRRAGASTGLHCCASGCPAWLGSFGADVVSFDASETSFPDAADVSALGDPHRTFAFGLVRASPFPDEPGAAFSRWLTAASSMGDPRALAARTIITPRCGLGRCTLAEAEATFQAVRDVATLIHECSGSIAQPSVAATP